MSRKQLALFEPTLVVQALKEAVKKLNPQAQWCDAWQCAV